MTCVCGHPRVDHRDTVMSVPLVGSGAGHYRLSGPPQIARVCVEANYDQQQCWCGCTLYEAL